MKTATRKETREEKVASAIYAAGGALLWCIDLNTTSPSQMLAWSIRGKLMLMQVWHEHDAVEVFWPSAERTIDGIIKEIQQD